MKILGKQVVTVLFLILFGAWTATAEDSMPQDVMQRVKANLERKYPGNYSVQKMLLDSEVEAWNKLQTNFVFDLVPDNVYVEIRDRIAARYADNFSVQVMLIEADAKSWKELNP